jgi:hypothetical protein
MLSVVDLIFVFVFLSQTMFQIESSFCEKGSEGSTRFQRFQFHSHLTPLLPQPPPLPHVGEFFVRKQLTENRKNFNLIKLKFCFRHPLGQISTTDVHPAAFFVLMSVAIVCDYYKAFTAVSVKWQIRHEPQVAVDLSV